MSERRYSVTKSGAFIHGIVKGAEQPIPLECERRKNKEGSLTQADMKKYRGLAGVLNWAARADASDMQQKLRQARLKHICSANGTLGEIQKLKPVVLIRRPSVPLQNTLSLPSLTNHSTYRQHGVTIRMFSSPAPHISNKRVLCLSTTSLLELEQAKKIQLLFAPCETPFC